MRLYDLFLTEQRSPEEILQQLPDMLKELSREELSKLDKDIQAAAQERKPQQKQPTTGVSRTSSVARQSAARANLARGQQGQQDAQPAAQ